MTVARSWLWALAPLYTLGFATPFTMANAAIRLRSKFQFASVAAYATAFVAEMLTAHGNAYPNRGVFDACLAVTLGVGAIHGVLLRPALVHKAEVGKGTGPATSLAQQQDAALAGLHDLEVAREHARKLASKNIQEARALGVGRPDLPNRTYPDGGLVDVNAVDAATLSTSLGMPTDLAERIIRLREQIDRFDDFGDLVMVMNSDGADLDPYKDRMIFLPKP